MCFALLSIQNRCSARQLNIDLIVKIQIQTTLKFRIAKPDVENHEIKYGYEIQCSMFNTIITAFASVRQFIYLKFNLLDFRSET